ncbi:MAG: hypothetical protein ACXW1W_06640 [Methylococcaceae bacterium]
MTYLGAIGVTTTPGETVAAHPKVETVPAINKIYNTLFFIDLFPKVINPY